jgi:hypothetical protein
MLFSPSVQIAFAHYPKTAGSSLTAWFCRCFADAAYVVPDVSHMPVRMGLETLGLGDTTGRTIRIFGVVREPFETLISLYEYWRRYEFPEEPAAEFIQAARTRSFAEFVRLAVVDGHLPNYEVFFDVGGPVWNNTRLLDFHRLEPALATVCREFEIDPPTQLDRRNAAPYRIRDARDYMAEAGDLVPEVRRHFRWYYEEAASILERGDVWSRRRAG